MGVRFGGLEVFIKERLEKSPAFASLPYRTLSLRGRGGGKSTFLVLGMPTPLHPTPVVPWGRNLATLGRQRASDARSSKG